MQLRVSTLALALTGFIAPGCVPGLVGGGTDTDVADTGDTGSGDGGEGGSASESSGATTTDGGTTTGDGDGDGTTTGDGDGDGTTTGDGTTGDGDGCEVGTPGCPCFPNDTCFAPLQCVNGTCGGDGDGDGDGYGACPNGDNDCLPNEVCVVGNSNGTDWTFCTPGPCQGDADCGFAPNDFCADLPGDGEPIDYCVSFDCTNMPCPPGMFCGGGFFGTDVCVWPAGGGCNPGELGCSCLPGGACDPGLSCSAGGMCVDPGGGLPDGSPCMLNAECAGGYCYSTGFGGSTCQSQCGMFTGCDEDADCCSGVCPMFGFCM